MDKLAESTEKSGNESNDIAGDIIDH